MLIKSVAFDVINKDLYYVDWIVEAMFAIDIILRFFQSY